MSTDQAALELLTAHENFVRVLASTTQPGLLQKAARDLTAAVDDWAEIRRSGIAA